MTRFSQILPFVAVLMGTGVVALQDWMQKSTLGEMSEDLDGNIERMERLYSEARPEPALLEAGTLPSEMTIIADNEQIAHALLEQVVLEAATTFNIELRGFGLAPSPQDISNKAVAYDLEGAGTLEDVVLMLNQFRDSSKRLALSSVWLRPESGLLDTETEQRIMFRLTIWTFWIAPLAESN